MEAYCARRRRSIGLWTSSLRCYVDSHKEAARRGKQQAAASSKAHFFPGTSLAQLVKVHCAIVGDDRFRACALFRPPRCKLCSKEVSAPEKGVPPPLTAPPPGRPRRTPPRFESRLAPLLRLRRGQGLRTVGAGGRQNKLAGRRARGPPSQRPSSSRVDRRRKPAGKKACGSRKREAQI